MPAPKLDKCSRVLIVEGWSDLLFFAEVLEHIGAHDGVFIKEVGGKGNLKRAALETFLSPGLLAAKKAIGVICDADAHPAGTCQSLENALQEITKQADVRTGQWTAGRPRIGLHVVPAADRAGEIESLVWEAWSNDPANARTKVCVDTFLACMQTAGIDAHSADKAKIGALLSVCNDDDPRLGPGARARRFDLARPEFAPLIAFLRGL